MRKEIINIIKYIAVYFVLLVTPVALVAVCEVANNHLHGGTMTSDEVWQTPYMTLGMLVCSLLIIAVFLWKRWAKLGLGRIERDDLWPVFLVSVSIFIGWYFPEAFLVDLIEVPSNLSSEEFDQMTEGVAGLINTGLITPIAEELLCRGAILTALLAIMPRKPWIAIIVQALVFGALHMNPSQTVYGTIYGLALGWLCWRSASLLPGIMVHVANNSAVMLMPDHVDESFYALAPGLKITIIVLSIIILVCSIAWFNKKYPALKLSEVRGSLSEPSEVSPDSAKRPDMPSQAAEDDADAPAVVDLGTEVGLGE